MAESSCSKLLSFRKYKNWASAYVASKLGISIADYNKLESEEISINNAIAKKLASLYDVPLKCFITENERLSLRSNIIFTNCTFNGNCSGYVNHQYNNQGIELALKEKNNEIKSLKLQIENLQQQNIKLLDLLYKNYNNLLKSK